MRTPRNRTEEVAHGNCSDWNRALGRFADRGRRHGRAVHHQAGEVRVTWASRAESPQGRTSPEDDYAAAHSACFSMALSNVLAKAGSPPTSIDTTAEVTFQAGQGIIGVALSTRGVVPGLTSDQFASAAEDAKINCPVSKALTGTTITLTAELVQE